jgi:hypothetical protein
VARGFGQGVEESLEAFGLTEFAGECGMDGHGKPKTLPRMTRIGRIFADRAGKRFYRKGREGPREERKKPLPQIYADARGSWTIGKRQSFSTTEDTKEHRGELEPFKETAQSVLFNECRTSARSTK